MIVNFYSWFVLSNTLTTIKQPKTRCLIVQDKKTLKVYLCLVKELDRKHNIYMKLHNLINNYRKILDE